VKALSLWEPWATLVRRGLKLYETRDWPMPASIVGQPLAIHAAKKVFVPERWHDVFRRQLSADEVYPPFSYGCILCVVHPHHSIKVGEAKLNFSMAEPARAKRELLYGNYIDIDPDSGKQRWATHLKDIRVLPEPIPFSGQQGIFNWPEGDALYQELW
jgi:activating signal cointegrator 1